MKLLDRSRTQCWAMGLRDRSVFIGHDIYSRDELMPNRLQSLFFF